MDHHEIVLEIQRLQESLDDLYEQVRTTHPLEDLPERESLDRLQLPDDLPIAERQVLEALELLSYTEGRITLGDIAATVFLSEAQTWRYLQRLETKRYVRRIGQRGGWELISD